jgi:dienelactone hydrolase
MNRSIHDGRRFLVQVLLCVNLVIWGACVAWADERPKVRESKPAEAFVNGTFETIGKSIRVWRFDAKVEGQWPAVVLLYGANGVESAKDMYCGAAKRLAAKGYAVFLVHYLDATPHQDTKKIGELVKRGLRGTATPEEARCVHDHFHVWMDCVRDGVGHVRKQPGVDRERVGVVGISLGGFVGLACASRQDLKLSAAISCFGGLPRAMHERVKSLPPTLVVHGDTDEVVSVEEAHALRKLGSDKKLPIEVVIYPKVGHVFQTVEGQFDMRALFDAERRMMAHLDKHLNAPPQIKVVADKP